MRTTNCGHHAKSTKFNVDGHTDRVEIHAQFLDLINWFSDGLEWRKVLIQILTCKYLGIRSNLLNLILILQISIYFG